MSLCRYVRRNGYRRGAPLVGCDHIHCPIQDGQGIAYLNCTIDDRRNVIYFGEPDEGERENRRMERYRPRVGTARYR
jgi:hypothetical protein